MINNSVRSTLWRHRFSLMLMLGALVAILFVLFKDRLLGDYGAFGPAQMAATAFFASIMAVGLYIFLSTRLPQWIANLFVMLISTWLFLSLAALIVEVTYKSEKVVAGWMPDLQTGESNDMGYRGQPIEYDDDDFVILLVGDSQAAAQNVSYYWMPEARLQHYLNTDYDLNTKVFTLAASGYGQDQQLLALQQYYQSGYRADLVIVWLTPVNDIWNNMFPRHFPTDGALKPTYHLQDGQLIGPNYQHNQVLIGSSDSQLVNLFENALYANIIPRDASWEAQYLPEPYHPFTTYDGSVNRLLQDEWESPLPLNEYVRYENLQNEKSHYAIYLTPRSPRMQYGIDLTNALLHEMQKLAADHSGHLITFEAAAPSRIASEPEVYVFDGLYYRMSADQYHQNVEDMSAGIDFYPMPVTIDPYRDSPTDGHLNDFAVDQVMRDFAAAIAALIQPTN